MSHHESPLMNLQNNALHEVDGMCCDEQEDGCYIGPTSSPLHWVEGRPQSGGEDSIVPRGAHLSTPAEVRRCQVSEDLHQHFCR